jgi:hypothetical protein
VPAKRAGWLKRFTEEQRRNAVKAFLASIFLTVFTSQAIAATCLEQANAKKLRSHAQEYFMKKCEEDAQKSCEALAKTKNLAGTAKRAFVKKCVADAVGT